NEFAPTGSAMQPSPPFALPLLPSPPPLSQRARGDSCGFADQSARGERRDGNGRQPIPSGPSTCLPAAVVIAACRLRIEHASDIQTSGEPAHGRAFHRVPGALAPDSETLSRPP